MARSSRFTGISGGSTAVTSATCQTGSKAVSAMTKEEFRNEKLYQATMHMVRNMLEEGIITAEEYHRVEEIFIKKYRPVLGKIFSDI